MSLVKAQFFGSLSYADGLTPFIAPAGSLQVVSHGTSTPVTIYGERDGSSPVTSGLTGTTSPGMLLFWLDKESSPIDVIRVSDGLVLISNWQVDPDNVNGGAAS